MRSSPPCRSAGIAAVLLTAVLAPARASVSAAPNSQPATPFAVQVRLLAVAGSAARVVPLDHPFAKAERVRFEVRPSRACYVRVVHTGRRGMRLRLWPEEGVQPLVADRPTVIPVGGVLRFDREGDQPVELVFSLVASPKNPKRKPLQVRLQPAPPAAGGSARFTGTLDGAQTATLPLTLRRR